MRTLPYPTAAGAATAQRPIAVPRRGAGFWIQLGALLIDFLVPTVPGTLLVLAVPAWSGAWVPVTLVCTFAYLTAFSVPPLRPLGMWLTRLVAVQLDGEPLDIGRAAFRSFVLMWSVALAGLGVLAIASDERRRGWHDHATSTIVVPAQPVPPA